jgi:uracil-DNA glycosylase
MLAALGSRAAATARRPGRRRSRCLIANTLKCRPPRNRNPSPEELAACEPFLQRQMALVQPRVILAMGRFAVQSLLRSDATHRPAARALGDGAAAAHRAAGADGHRRHQHAVAADVHVGPITVRCLLAPS